MELEQSFSAVKTSEAGFFGSDRGFRGEKGSAELEFQVAFIGLPENPACAIAEITIFHRKRHGCAVVCFRHNIPPDFRRISAARRLADKMRTSSDESTKRVKHEQSRF